ncbi:hypothetical protein [Streptomyces pseudovenezuelae]|uniref:Uncharacterized protein n=1 Tax=Streptomyces pseudovenezuelae TaxID=67350 RepID=A0ABT6LD07_9ACTN|nr:hypothetical protein [Streptomyces pseudovenezuelae]MDH6213805.1 hypothetical protein [Streptomyces pseudovenezuelae]
MADEHHKGPDGGPVPRDLPDQQAREGEDPWEAAPGADAWDGAAEDVPDTDEAGTGRQGAARPATVHPEHPTPDESSA